jgi:6-phosphogluconolactonase
MGIVQWIKNTDAAAGEMAIAGRLRAELAAGKRVLWLVCGGSNIASEIDIMNRISDELSTRLTIMLTDERYGAVGHQDSNSQQLLAGGFKAKQATFLPVLQDLPLAETVTSYAATAQEQFAANDIIIAQFGIGPDGHIAGVLPGSPAVNAEAWAAAYEAPPFTRITLTPPALSRIAVAYALVFGDGKREALTKLRDEDLPLAEEPSQILKRLPEAFVYNDQVAERG